MDSVERVKNMVRHTLVVKPEVTNRELLARAQEIAPDAVEGLSLRQFHGRFRLPIMRFELGSRRKAKAAAKPAAVSANGSATATAAAMDSGEDARESKPKQKRTRRSTVRPSGVADSPAVDTAVRDILVEFAVELEKAESRSDLVQVMGGVHTFVGRITAVAREYYKSPRGRNASEN